MLSLNILVKTCVTGKPESFSNKEALYLYTYVPTWFRLSSRLAKKYCFIIAS